MAACGGGSVVCRCSLRVVRQVVIQVGVAGTGHMALRKLLRAGSRVHQVEGAVEHRQRGGAGLKLLKLFGGDEGGEHGVWWPGGGRSMKRAQQLGCHCVWGQCSSGGGLAMVLARSMVAVMPLAMMRAMPSQPTSGSWSSKITML